jgi:hypothetical protein
MSTIRICQRLSGYFFALAMLLSASVMTLGADVTAVEEDWQLDIDTPSAARSSPQLNCVMSATGDNLSYYAVLLINQQSSQGGGLELQLWHGQTLLSSSQLANTASLGTMGERIQWTTQMSLSNNGVLTVQILSGSSTTWGRFGGKSELIVSAQTPLQNLNFYNVNFSTGNSGVEFGNQRVSKLILRKVRVYESNKKSTEQALERIVFQNR